MIIRKQSVIFIFVMIFTLAISSCVGLKIQVDLKPQTELCSIEDLLITVSDLPGDQWYESGSRSYRDAPSRLGIERIGTGFTTDTGGASENVYRFKNATAANEGYFELSSKWERLVSDGTYWYTLDLPSDITIEADNYRLECSVTGANKVRKCWFIAQYDTTVIEFKSYMIGIDDNDFFNIIKNIDSKAINCQEGEK
jgi:hypothetical protein